MTVKHAEHSKLAEVLSHIDEVQAAYLFGSRAEGRASTGSDLDIGLVIRGSTHPGIKLDILEELTRAGFDDIDLVILNGADPILRWEAVRPNTLIFARRDFDHPSYFSLALRMHEDEVHRLRWHRAALKERLQRDPA